MYTVQISENVVISPLVAGLKIDVQEFVKEVCPAHDNHVTVYCTLAMSSLRVSVCSGSRTDLKDLCRNLLSVCSTFRRR